MKQRFSSLDVKVIAHELSKSLCTLRLANVYDLSSRIFLLKFAKPNHRQQMVIDSGFRCHLTDFTRATACTPSQFVIRLRKYLRTRRVTSIAQVGTDRIIEFQFSDGQYRLFLEFYAGGNIVLTDKDLGILSLLRIVPEGEEQEELRVGLKYSVESRQNYNGVPTLTKQRVLQGLVNSTDRAKDEGSAPLKKSKKKTGDALRKALSTSLNEFPPMLIDHAFRMAGFDPNTAVENVLKDDALQENLMLVLRRAQRVIEQVVSSGSCKGYIIMKRAKPRSNGQKEPQEISIGHEESSWMYEDFHPFRPAQFEGNPETQTIEFDGFNKTVDEFFSSIEGQKLESRLAEREENAKRKLTVAKQDHDKRIGGLQQVQELNVRKAQAIEANLQRVQEATIAVNGLIAQGMDWVEIARLIEIEQARQNNVAEMIKLPLKLYENTATLLLVEADYDDEEDYDGDQTDSDISDSEDEQHQIAKSSKPDQEPKAVDKRLAVDVDLALSPWSNARRYYEQKKNAAVKEQKTLQSSAKVLQNTERKIAGDLKKGLKQEKDVLRPVHKQLWFEKFFYFISSEGYLVVGGKDAQQAEILYRRHLTKGDVYVHAELQGAASVIIKNKHGMIDSPIPPSTLSQAGTLTVATSTAWESKAGMSAWWVDSDKVSKMASNGDFLAVGSFSIQGQKNFLPPAPLLLGFGIMFQISHSSKARHFKNRFQEENALKNVDKVDSAEDGVKDEPRHEGKVLPNSDIDYIGSLDHSDNENPMCIARGQESDGAEDRDEDDRGSNTGHDNPLQPNLARTGKIHVPKVKGSPVIPSDHGPAQTTAAASDDDEDSEGGQEQNQKSVPSTHREPGTEPTASSSIFNLNPSLTSPTPCSNPTPSSQTPRIRGKHGKRAKLKTKYANQDEEDRALALRLLGSAAEHKETNEAAAKLAKEQELAAQKEKRRQQHAITAEKGKEAEQLRKTKFEEGIEVTGQDELVDLEGFVGMPLPGDEILDALVICGPWDAVGARCRWRVKMQPGMTKKGKAVREILGKWTSVLADWEKRKTLAGEGVDEAITKEMEMRRREGDLVKGIREAEVVGLVPVGKVRVVLGAEAGGRGKGAAGAGKGKRGERGSKRK